MDFQEEATLELTTQRVIKSAFAVSSKELFELLSFLSLTH